MSITPEPVVRAILCAASHFLKSHFRKADGLASEDVTILIQQPEPLTFPAEAIKVAIEEYKDKYGESIHNLIKHHILPHFYAIELMMALYTVGHLKISYLLAEHGYELSGMSVSETISIHWSGYTLANRTAYNPRHQ